MSTSRTIIIASGAYLDPQLEVEFGRIPPSFLPLGGKRLYEHQYRLLSDLDARLILSLPEDFVISDQDAQMLTQLGIELLRVPAGLSLGASIVYIINLAACAGGPVSILHGDTLFEGFDLDIHDVVSTGPIQVGYEWGQVYETKGVLVSDSDRELVSKIDPAILTGWFSFSDGFSLVQAITKKGGNFLEGVLSYAKKYQLKTFHANDWFDFGHADTYYQSRRRITTQRSFNDLEITKRQVTKRSDNSNKISAEAAWFENLPAKLRIYTPALLSHEKINQQESYSLEYLHLPTLSELLVFGRLPVGAWSKIFNAADEVLNSFAENSSQLQGIDNIDDIYGKKTNERLEQYSRSASLDLSAPCRFNGSWLPSINHMVSMVSELVPPATSKHLGLVHGDFCFSNLLYDHRADLLKIIDPRGIDGAGIQTSFGDRRYDIAKMYHSVIGRYDQIIAGHYQLTLNNSLDMTLVLPAEQQLLDIEAEFNSHCFGGLSLEDSSAPAICVMLFLSMLPLHADRPDRQHAFLANAMRLFLMLDSSSLRKLK
jgi:hypothetical protein